MTLLSSLAKLPQTFTQPFYSIDTLPLIALQFKTKHLYSFVAVHLYSFGVVIYHRWIGISPLSESLWVTSLANTSVAN